MYNKLDTTWSYNRTFAPYVEKFSGAQPPMYTGQKSAAIPCMTKNGKDYSGSCFGKEMAGYPCCSLNGQCTKMYVGESSPVNQIWTYCGQEGNICSTNLISGLYKPDLCAQGNDTLLDFGKCIEGPSYASTNQCVSSWQPDPL